MRFFLGRDGIQSNADLLLTPLRLALLMTCVSKSNQDLRPDFLQSRRE
jgi:hypothetical protein